MTDHSDCIVDIKISISSANDSELLRIGYEQIVPDIETWRLLGNNAISTKDYAQLGSFGKNQSIWVWRRKSGTCSGRLKPIIDIQLDSSYSSTALVISGYNSIPTPLANQTVWIKRATSDEEEQDAIHQLHISLGKMKNPGDKIWVSPGLGWIRVDGNFVKSSIFSSYDAFLWFKPLRARSLDSHMSSPIRAVMALSDEAKLTRILTAVRTTLRHYIPIHEMRALANPLVNNDNSTISVNQSQHINKPLLNNSLYDISTLFHQYSLSKANLSLSQYSKLIIDVGLHMDKVDIGRSFRFIDISSNGVITLEEFVFILTLTDYELDLVIDNIRLNLQNINIDNIDSHLSIKHQEKISNNSSIQSPLKTKELSKRLSKNLTYSQIFQSINSSNDGILTTNEFSYLIYQILDIYLTNDEIYKIMKYMDIDCDNRIEEKDFVLYMKKDSYDVIIRKSQRLYDLILLIKRYFIRNITTSTIVNRNNNQSNNNKKLDNNINIDQQWLLFKSKFEYILNLKFKGYLTYLDITLLLMKLNVFISWIEGKELIFIITSINNGITNDKIQKKDLISFISTYLNTNQNITNNQSVSISTNSIVNPSSNQSNSIYIRTFGEMLVFINKYDIIIEIVDSYLKFKESLHIDGYEDNVLLDSYNQLIYSLISKFSNQIDLAVTSNINSNSDNKAKDFIISVSQLKSGFDSLVNNTSHEYLNYEEISLLSCLTGSDVLDDNNYGIMIYVFIDKLVTLLTGGSLFKDITNGNYFSNLSMNQLDENTLLDISIRELTNMLIDISTNPNNNIIDLAISFNIFTRDIYNHISSSEFKKTIKQLRLFESINILDKQQENLLNLLYNAIDKHSVGYITYNDYVSFINKHKDSVVENNINGNVEDGLGDSHISIPMVPPISITNNQDCDWFIWFIYRQAYKLNPSNPDDVIKELEIICEEQAIEDNMNGSIRSIKLWDILYDLDLINTTISKKQYEAGVKFLLFDHIDKSIQVNNNSRLDSSTDKLVDTTEVDYEALCRYTLRMGRSFQQHLEKQKKSDYNNYIELKKELKLEFLEIMRDNKSSEGSSQVITQSQSLSTISKCEKIFRRLDTDSDGCLTISEFKSALKILRIKSEKKWNKRMIQLLFDEIDRNHDGHISISEFTSFINLDDDRRIDYNIKNTDEVSFNDTSNSLNLKSAMKSTNKSMSKSMLSSTFRRNYSHNNIYDSDSDDNLEEYLNLSNDNFYNKVKDVLIDLIPIDKNNKSLDKHMDDVISVIRNYFLKADINKEGIVNEDRFQSFLRRSKLQRQLTTAELSKLHNDLRINKNQVNYEKLINMIKNIKASDNSNNKSKDNSDKILLQLQEACYNSSLKGKSFLSLCNLFDNKSIGCVSKFEFLSISKILGHELSESEVQSLLDTLPNVYTNNNIDYNKLNVILTNYTPRNNQILSNMNTNNFTPYLTTPLDIQLPTDFTRSINLTSNNRNTYSDPNIYDKILQFIANRIDIGISDRSNQLGYKYNIYKQFYYYDNNRNGSINIIDFQLICNDIGVSLSSSDIHALLTVFGRLNDQIFNYELFFNKYLNNKLNNNLSNSLTNNVTTNLSNSLVNRVDKTLDTITYNHPKIINIWKNLIASNKNPRDYFVNYDYDRSGMIDKNKFRDVIERYQLLQTEYQLNKAIDDFTSLIDRSQIIYDDFCKTMERLAHQSEDSMDNRRYANGDGFDGNLSLNKTNISIHDNIRKFRRSLPNEIDDDDDDDIWNRRDLTPPKITDSVNMIGSTSPFKSYESSYNNRSANRSNNMSQSLTYPRNRNRDSSPSKIGSRVWGTSTSIENKGIIPKINDNTWVCAVCYFIDNPKSSNACTVCDAPNYSVMKDYQLKEQCMVCTFPNGQFALECEMCGEPLSTNKSINRRR